jgi:putative membrane protein
LEFYNHILVFHIISFISWFAMLFYLPRLFVYHAENSKNDDFTKVAKVMERKLIKFIGYPAMWATILSGLTLSFLGDFFSSGGWLHLKTALVLSLLGYHIYLDLLRKKLEKENCSKSGRFFRFLNEFPTIIMIVVVILVIFKPF